MTPRMLNLLSAAVWDLQISGPVLEFGSYIEANQEHLDLRTAFPRGTVYVGADVIDGPGVDRRCDLLDEGACTALADEVRPGIVLCLYVLEHAWDIRRAATTLGAVWHRHPESWLWVSTHQNQPFHGTPNYGDYWRITGTGMRRLVDESGLGGARVLVHPDSSNPEDVLAVRPPASRAWPNEEVGRLISAMAARHQSQWELNS